MFDGYDQRIGAIINQVLENDLLSIEDASFATVQKTKRMLVTLATSAPRRPT